MSRGRYKSKGQGQRGGRLGRRVRRSRWRWVLLLAVGLIVLALLLLRWKLPQVVERSVTWFWGGMSDEPLDFEVREARWGFVALDNLQLPGTEIPVGSIGSIEVGFDGGSLVRGKLASLELNNVQAVMRREDGRWHLPLLNLFSNSASRKSSSEFSGQLPLRHLQVAGSSLIFEEEDGTSPGSILVDGLVEEIAPEIWTVMLDGRWQPGEEGGGSGWSAGLGDDLKLNLQGGLTNQFLTLEAAATMGQSAASLQLQATLPQAGNWTLEARLPEHDLGGDDDFTRLLLSFVPLEGLSVSGRVGGSATLRGAADRLTVTMMGSVTNLAAAAANWEVMGVGGQVELMLRRDRLRTFGEQVLRFESARVAKMGFDGGEIRWQMEPGRIRVASADLNWLGGQLHTYALNFDLNKHDTECVLYVDGIEVAQLLQLIKPLAGTGEGRLYGRIPVRYADERWRLSTSYLYSIPGHEGLIKLYDTGPLEALLAQAGLARDVRQNLTRALKDFRFTAFAIELHPPESGGELLLTVRLQGQSRDRRRPTPVDATLNLRGPLETLLNVGMSLGQRQD